MKKTFLLIILFFSTFYLHSQDPHFSQFFDSNRAFTNPAFTGIDGGITVNANHRNQWFKIPGVFETSALSIQATSPCRNTAFGFHVLHNREGEGKLNTLNAALDYVYVLRIKDNNNIRFGLSTNWSAKWIKWDELIFSDQLHYKDGFLGNNSSMTERLYGERPMSLGFKAGIVHRFDWKRKGKKDISISYGLGVSHIGNFRFTQAPPDGFYNTDALPLRYSFYGSFILPFMRYVGASGFQFMLVPHVRYDQQSKIKKTTIGATAYIGDFSVGAFYENTFLWAGNKNTDAAILYFGYFLPSPKKNDIELGFSYNLNNVPTGTHASNLGGLSGGVFEINMRFLFYKRSILCNDRKSRKRRGKTDCTSFKSNYRSAVKEYGRTNKFYRNQKN